VAADGVPVVRAAARLDRGGLRNQMKVDLFLVEGLNYFSAILVSFLFLRFRDSCLFYPLFTLSLSESLYLYFTRPSQSVTRTAT
jgi:hypothetical protein